MRHFKTQEEIEQERHYRHSYGRHELPTHKKLLIYARQSTSGQVKNNTESYEQQTIELVTLALSYGWKREDIFIFVENEYDKYGVKTGKIRDASGNLSIDERAALKIITKMIEQGDVGAVMVWDVSRLTRDKDVIDGQVFAKLCGDHSVLLLTQDDDNFNFNKREDLERFIGLAIAAKNYLSGHMSKMLAARDRVAARGEWSVYTIPTGLMLDDARKQYIPNPVWSPIIARLFVRFRELEAEFTAFRREIVDTLLFPDLPADIAVRIGQIVLTRVHGGYTVKSIDGLKSILTNVAYIGHVMYKGQIVKYNAHPAIVNEQDFFFAFNALSETDIDGHSIEREKRVIRHEQHSDRERTEALLAGTRVDGRAVIVSPNRTVHVAQKTSIGREACYVIRDRSGFYDNECSISVCILDKLIEKRLM